MSDPAFAVRIHRKNQKVPLPRRATEGSAGLDIVACIDSPVLLEPGEPALIPTGLHLGMSVEWEAQIRPRSRLNAAGILVGFGTVDADFRGELHVTVVNVTKRPYEILPGDRIAQLVFATVERPTWIEVETVADLGETSRGAGGFGSTGR